MLINLLIKKSYVSKYGYDTTAFLSLLLQKYNNISKDYCELLDIKSDICSLGIKDKDLLKQMLAKAKKDGVIDYIVKDGVCSFKVLDSCYSFSDILVVRFALFSKMSPIDAIMITYIIEKDLITKPICSIAIESIDRLLKKRLVVIDINGMILAKITNYNRIVDAIKKEPIHLRIDNFKEVAYRELDGKDASLIEDFINYWTSEDPNKPNTLHFEGEKGRFCNVRRFATFEGMAKGKLKTGNIYKKHYL